MTKTIVLNPTPSFYFPTEVLPEPTNWNNELDQLLQDHGFEMIYLMDDDYIGYIHPQTGFEVEYNTLNLKTCYTIFPYGRKEYYEKETKGSLVEVDTLDEVMDLLAIHISL